MADAVAFAHAGGVIHRDLKPENVMLGDYGEVLVMDWGLARITPEFAHVDAVYQADSLGGTPAYMAPEMAKGPVESINKTSDVYLLGAILYEIIGGQPPHSGRDVMQCLMAASQNRIDPIRYDGELKEIALKAMATQQEDRYQTVKEFQEAVRVYQSHSESLVLTAHANQNLQKARASNDYQLFARALYGFQESLTLWDANHRARTLLDGNAARLRDRCARERRLGPGGSLLDTQQRRAPGADDEDRRGPRRAQRPAAPAAAGEDGGRRADRRHHRHESPWLYSVVSQAAKQGDRCQKGSRARASARKKSEGTPRIAEEAEEAIAKQRRSAKEEEESASKEARQGSARRSGTAARRSSDCSTERSGDAKKAEEYEAYIAADRSGDRQDRRKRLRLRLAAARAKQARAAQLGVGPAGSPCASSSSATYDAAGPVDAVAYSPDGKSFATRRSWPASVTVRDAQTGAVRFEARHGQYVLVGRILAGWQARSPAAAATRRFKIHRCGQRQRAEHAAKATPTACSPCASRPTAQQLLSGSYDNTARLWDVATRQTLQELKGHSWWVWAAEFSPDGNRIVTAGQDGKAIVWQKQGARERRSSERGQAANPSAHRPSESPVPSTNTLTEFTGHNGAVYTARFSPNGDLVATGGYDKLVMVWNPDEVQPVDIEQRLDGEPEPKANYLRLAGHDGPVRSVAFSPNGQLCSAAAKTIRFACGTWRAASQ